MVAPLTSAGKAYGFIDISSSRTFSDDEKNRFKTFAEQISGVIQKINAENERVEKLNELELIYQTFVESSHLNDVDEICEHLAAKILDVNPDCYVMVSLYDPEVKAIRVRALKGIEDKLDGLIKLVGKNPKDIIVTADRIEIDGDSEDIFTSPAMELIPGGIYQLARGAIPKVVCKSVERFMGVDEIYISGFGLENKQIGGVVLFVKEGKKINYPAAIETITKHVATLFERRQVQSEIEKRQIQLEALHTVELEIASQLDQEKLLQTIAEEARSIVGAEACGFSIVNLERDVLEYLAYNGLHDLPENTDIHRGEGLSGKVWETQETLIVENYTEWEGHSENWEDVGNYNLVGIPVIWGEEFLGVLEIATGIEAMITPSEITTLELFATQAAIAVKNARLYQDEMMRRQEAETLREVGLLINRIMDRGELLEMILTSLKKVVPYHGASIQLVQGNKIVIEAFIGPQPSDKVIGTEFMINENPISQMILHEGEQIILSDHEQVTKLLRGPTVDDIQSFIAVPLEVKGNRIGIIALDHSQANQYSQHDLDLVTAFATQATLALENNRLFDEIRRRTREIELVYESAMGLTRELHPDLLFEHLRKQVGNMFHQDGFLLAAYNENNKQIEIVYASEDGFQHEHAMGLEIPLDERNSLLSWIVRKKTPLLIGNVETDSLPVQPIQEGKTIRSWLGVPLLVGNRVIGALVVQSYHAYAFTPDDQRLLELLGNQAAVALENSRLFDDAQKRLSRLSSLREIDLAISGSVDLELTMGVLVSQLINSLDVDAACVLIYNPEKRTLEYISSKGFQTKSLQHTSLRLGEGLAGKAAEERSLIRIPDLREQQTSLDRAPSLKKESFVSYLAHPLIAKGELVGVLEVFHRERLDPNTEWINFLSALASVAGIAIDRLNLFNDLSQSNFELQQAYDATIEGWARAIEMRDNSTSEHSRRVVALTMNLARKLGIEGDRLTHIRRGALLHDIGKMAIPDGILLKSGKLTDEEWRLMKLHPQYAYDMLSSIKYLKPALDIPYSHHERWDGAGYPRGLVGDEIPIAARIFAVVDVWDALQSDRSYRDAWPREKAVAYLKEQSGIHFDPQVVEAFLDLVGTS
jgi:putative nucleotidyltransferase with HDIG domain